jgi:RHS repeat-associated protein
MDGATVMAGYALKCQASTDVAPTPAINWTFGDGGTAKGLAPAHIYQQLGDFTVTCNGTGVTVTVTPPPAPIIQSFTGAATGNATGASVLIVKGQSATLSWAVSGVLLSNSINQGVGAQANSGSVTVSPTVSTTYTLTTTNLGGTRTQQVAVSVLDITSFTASPANLTLGGSSTLAWAVTGGPGGTVAIDQGIGTIATSGSRAVSPQKTTTYTLTANCAAGSMTKSLTVGLNAPILTNVAASATRIALNGSTTLSWNVTGASEVRVLANGVLLDTVGNPVATNGSLTVSPTSMTTYTVEAMNATAMMMDTVTVDVVAPPIISGFGAMPSTIVAGDTGATLTWNAVGYDTLSISGGVGTVTASGVQVNPTATTTYTLTATNIASTVTKNCTVTVVNAPIIRAFTASPMTISPGASTTLLWDVGGATSLSITGVAAPLGPYSVGVAPSATTTYTMTASNASGSTTASVTVTVSAPNGTSYPPRVWQRSMVYGFGSLIAEERPTGTVYIQSDQVGTPNLTTNTSGMIVGASKNLPFGERFGNLGDKSLRRYTNHEDQDGSAIYMQARTYLPAYGKFAQVDPAYDQTKDDPESWNLYNYVTNNPVTSTDPTGMWEWGTSLGGSATNADLIRSGNWRAVLRRSDFSNAVQAARSASISDAGDRAAYGRAMGSYGTANDSNGLKIEIGSVPAGDNAVNKFNAPNPGDPLVGIGPDGGAVALQMTTFNGSLNGGFTSDLSIDIPHEGSHQADRQDIATEAATTGNYNGATNITVGQSETRAYTVSGIAGEANGREKVQFRNGTVWNSSWKPRASAVREREKGVSSQVKSLENKEKKMVETK